MTHVIVVGAGPVGLVSALALAERKVNVTILETATAISQDLRASTFHPPTLDMLDKYGLTDGLLAAGLISPTWQIRMHATGDNALFDLSLIADVTAHPYRLQCEQAVLCDLIAKRLENHPFVDFRLGTTFTGAHQTNHDVEVSATHHTNATPCSMRADFVIGADGAGSRVRDSIGLDFDGETYPETTVLASTTFAFEDHINGLSNVNYCWSETGNFALLRLKHLWRCSLYFDPELTFEESVEPSRIQDQLSEIYPASKPFDIVDCRPYRVHQRIVPSYQVGRVFLAGDAAHINSPSGGMGMNGGIHDALSLTYKMGQVFEGIDHAALEDYTAERLPVAKHAIAAQADRNRKRMTQKNPSARQRALETLQATAADPTRAREYLLRSSMIDGLSDAKHIWEPRLC